VLCALLRARTPWFDMDQWQSETPFSALRVAADSVRAPLKQGRVVDAIGTLVRGVGLNVKVGELCGLQLGGPTPVLAEVIGFAGDKALLAPMGPLAGVSDRTPIVSYGRTHSVRAGDHLLGRTLDGLGGRYIDSVGGVPEGGEWVPVLADPPVALLRQPIREPIELGLRAIDGLLTCAVGQRVGIFAPAGCGKSTLLGAIASNAVADVIVFALIGERGREVGEFVEHVLGPTAMARSVLIVATSDRPAMERVRAAQVATAVAEYFRDQGKSVLLMVDSVTRYARALREIGLAAGEPPARRGFPPSVFASLPQLFERAGQGVTGAITAFYTVLEETDDGLDPVSEEVRSLLDGHIVLSRELASVGHFPAIDILKSASRVMGRLVPPEHIAASSRVKELWAKYRDLEILIQVGEYKRGEDDKADAAVDMHPAIKEFLRQDVSESVPFLQTRSALEALQV
jgi:type III secretion protein N (ATPase)